MEVPTEGSIIPGTWTLVPSLDGQFATDDVVDKAGTFTVR